MNDSVGGAPIGPPNLLRSTLTTISFFFLPLFFPLGSELSLDLSMDTTIDPVAGDATIDPVAGDATIDPVATLCFFLSPTEGLRAELVFLRCLEPLQLSSGLDSLGRLEP